MNKPQLINEVVARTGIEKSEAEKILKGFFTAIRDNVMEGNKVWLRGFGDFELKPKTNRTPLFTPFKYLVQEVRDNFKPDAK